MLKDQLVQSVKVFNILLVEDSIDDRVMFKYHLKNCKEISATVTECETLESALNALEQNEFDIAFLDRMLPDAINDQAFKIISEKHPEVPIVMLTTISDIEVATSMIQMGVQDYISKENLSNTDLDRIIRYSINRFKLQKDLQVQKMRLSDEMNAGLIGKSLLLSSQMSPHFIFNALNAVQFQILQDNSVEAVSFLGEFAKLMRMVLTNSRQERIAISDEMDFIELYIALEQKRYQDNFDFSINVDDEIDPQTLIPPMLLQPFIENAIIHGLGNLKKQRGHLKIDILKQDEKVVCKIIDNGVGIESSEELKEFSSTSHSESFGMKITNERFDVLNRLNWGNFDLNIESRADGESGTEVTITFHAN